jgi:hypothetical protein
MGCIFAELLHCIPQSASAASTFRVLFPGKSCRLETADSARPNYDLPVFANEMLGKFFAVLGRPSVQDVEEFARASGDAAAAEVSETVHADLCESVRLQAEDDIVQLLTRGYETCTGISAPVDFMAKYSAAASECPAAVSLLVQMLAFAPSKRISCSEALQHDFLNPIHVPVTVDGTVGDGGHERAMRTAVRLKQLNIEGLCRDEFGNRDSAKIGELLIREAELIKLPLTPRL